jgi:hypothetical protein
MNLFRTLNADWLQWINLLVVVLIPTVVALVTKASASRRFKSITLVALSLVGTIATSVADDGGFTYNGIAQLFVQNTVYSIAMYYGVSKPTGLAGTASPVAQAAPDKGIG